MSIFWRSKIQWKNGRIHKKSYTIYKCIEIELFWYKIIVWSGEKKLLRYTLFGLWKLKISWILKNKDVIQNLSHASSAVYDISNFFSPNQTHTSCEDALKEKKISEQTTGQALFWSYFCIRICVEANDLATSKQGLVYITI